jgi:hypothetical protein
MNLSTIAVQELGRLGWAQERVREYRTHSTCNCPACEAWYDELYVQIKVRES